MKTQDTISAAGMLPQVFASSARFASSTRHPGDMGSAPVWHSSACAIIDRESSHRWRPAEPGLGPGSLDPVRAAGGWLAPEKSKHLARNCATMRPGPNILGFNGFFCESTLFRPLSDAQHEPGA